jgi:hypothetical protein
VQRIHGLVPWVVAVLAAAYVLALGSGDTVDGWAAVVGTLLLLTAELATWSIEADDRIHEERPVVVRRVALLFVLAAASLLLGMLVVSAAAVSGSAGVAAATAGVVAAVLAVALVLRLARSV